MTVELRRVAPEELVEWRHTGSLAFGWSSPDAADRATAAVYDPARALVGVDGGRMVATAANLALDLALPGARRLAIAGVSMVTVQPTHRRRGLLQRMVGELLDDAVAHGEPAA
jgi:hypothetical protein